MKSNVTIEQIRERLQEVFTNASQKAIYNSASEQYEGVCGWCGVMSPLTRPAFVKYWGEETVAQAEAGALVDIEQWREVYAGSEWAVHKTEADKHESDGQPVPTEGDFCWAETSWMKCDGGKGFMSEIENHWYLEHDADRVKVRHALVKVEKVIQVSAEDLDRAALADELAAAEQLPGGGWREDDKHLQMVAPYELSYVKVAVVTDGTRYYYIDAEGYDYARYILFPTDWRTFFAEQIAAFERKKADEQQAEQQAAEEEHAQAIVDYQARCKRWSGIMRSVIGTQTKLDRENFGTPKYKALRREISSIRRANILAMCRRAFPGVKFSLKKNNGWGASWDLTYIDGPTEEVFQAATDLDLFVTHYDTFDGMTDCADTETIPEDLSTFARKYMGKDGSKGVKVTRKMSDETRKELCTKVSESVPALVGDKPLDKCNLPAEVRNQIANLVGHEVDRYYYNVLSIAREIFAHTDYYTAPAKSEPVEKNNAANVDNVANEDKVLTSEAYSEKAIVVRGYNEEQYSELISMGGKYNRRLKGGAGIIFSAKKHGEDISAYIAKHTA